MLPAESFNASIHISNTIELVPEITVIAFFRLFSPLVARGALFIPVTSAATKLTFGPQGDTIGKKELAKTTPVDTRLANIHTLVHKSIFVCSQPFLEVHTFSFGFFSTSFKPYKTGKIM